MRKTQKVSDDERMQELLTYLRLPFMRAHYGELSEKAHKASWSHLAYLEHLIKGEADLRQQHGIERRIRQARFPLVKHLEQYDFKWPKKIDQPQVKDLFRFKFVNEKSNVILLGGVGLGKSHLALALGHQACTKGHTVLFSTAVDIINTLAAAQATDRLAVELKKFLRPELLIIDELGYLPIDKHGADLLFQVISKRYERGSMVITTNKAFKDWPEVFGNDATLTSAVLDRLLHHAQTVVIEGSSYRMRGRAKGE